MPVRRDDLSELGVRQRLKCRTPVPVQPILPTGDYAPILRTPPVKARGWAEELLLDEHVFPAQREPVTGRTKSVQHEIITKDARPVRCGPRRLAPAGLRKEQDCVQDMLTGGQIEPSDSPWASPVVLVTKKDGSTRFCVY